MVILVAGSTGRETWRKNRLTLIRFRWRSKLRSLEVKKFGIYQELETIQHLQKPNRLEAKGKQTLFIYSYFMCFLKV